MGTRRGDRQAVALDFGGQPQTIRGPEKKQYESAAGFFSKKKERKERAADTGMDFFDKTVDTNQLLLKLQILLVVETKTY